MPRRKDDIDAILVGEKESPKVRETDNVSEQHGWDKPQNRVPSPATLGEEVVKYRSGGKGHQGFSIDEKIDVMRVCHAIKRVVGEQEAFRISFLLMEQAAKEREWVKKQNKKMAHLRSGHVEMLEYIAKEMR